MGIMINRRRVCGGGEKLPQGAVRIEYLESSGTQWIDTGFIPDNTSGIYLKSMVITDRHNETAVGVRQDGGNSRWMINFAASTRCIEISWNTYMGYNYSYVGRIVEVENNYLNSRLGKIDGITKRTLYDTLATISYSCTIFCANFYGNIPFIPFFGRIYNVKLSRGNDVVMDFIPVRVGQIGYMYDKVSGQLFGNAGTGDFILGPDK